MQIAAISFALLVVAVLSALRYLKYRMVHAADQGDLQAAIDREAGKFRKQAQVAGLVIGVYKSGRSFIKGYGAVDAIPDATTTFQIGSISKVFTATLLQILCDEGVVGMDATLGDLLGRAMPLSPAARQVTLRQLATHTAGFPSIPKPLATKITEAAAGDDPLVDPYSHLGPQHVFDYLATTPDKKDAGRFRYSNFGMGLLAHVLEVVTGKDYESLLEEKILVPLGMAGTGITLTSEMQARLAQGHTAKGVPARVWHFAALAGAGAISSNAQDMLGFIRANVEEGGPLAAALRRTREPQFGGDTGIGWLQPGFMDRFVGNDRIVWHNGMVAGYASYLAVDAAAKTGVVVLTNKALAPDMLGMMLARQLRTQSWAADRAC